MSKDFVLAVCRYCQSVREGYNLYVVEVTLIQQVVQTAAGPLNTPELPTHS